LDCVVFSSLQLAWEARKTKLTSIEAIPDMVHHAVQCVIEACFLIQDVDRLDAPIVGIGIERLKEKQTNVAVLTVVSIPHVSPVLAVRVLASDVGATGTNELESASGVGWSDTVP
jgi:hypothetical protein